MSRVSVVRIGTWRHSTFIIWIDKPSLNFWLSHVSIPYKETAQNKEEPTQDICRDHKLDIISVKKHMKS